MDIIAGVRGEDRVDSQKDNALRLSDCGSFLIVAENDRNSSIIGYELRDLERARNLSERALALAQVNPALELRLAEPAAIGFLPLYEARLEATNEFGGNMDVSIRCTAGTEEPVELVFYDPTVPALPEVTTDMAGTPIESRSYHFSDSSDFSLDSADMPSGFNRKSA